MIRNNRRLSIHISFPSSPRSDAGTHLSERVNSFELFRRRDRVPEVDFNVVRDVQFLRSESAIHTRLSR